MEGNQPKQDLGKTSSGMQPHVAALLSYVLGLVTGLVFYLTEKENQFVRFHAMQSIGVSAALFILSVAFMVVPLIGGVLRLLLNLVGLALWIVCMFNAYQGKWFRLPVVGDIAAKQSGLST